MSGKNFCESCGKEDAITSSKFCLKHTCPLCKNEKKGNKKTCNFHDEVHQKNMMTLKPWEKS